MAGFGKTLLRGLAGAAEGYGDYLQTQGKIQAEQQIEEVRTQRAMALERFRADIQADRDATQNQYRREEMVLGGMINRTNSEAELRGRAANDAAGDARDFELWKKKNEVEFGQWQQKSSVELSNSKKLELFKSERQIAQKAAEEGMKPAGDDVDEATGTRVLYFRDAQGNVRPYDTGVVVQTKSETNPFTNEVTRQTAAPTKKATRGWRDEQQPTQQQRGSKTLSTSEAQSALTAGIRKAKAGEPGWAGLNDRQVANKVRDVYRAAGYEVPDLK